MRYEVFRATSPFDSSMPIEIIILILFCCNIIYFMYHYFDLLSLKQKLNKIDFKNFSENQKQKNVSNKKQKLKLSTSFYFEIIEIVNSISKSKSTNNIQFGLYQQKLKSKIIIILLNRNKTFYFPVLAFIFLIVDVLLKLNIMNSTYFQSKHLISLFSIYIDLVGPLFVIINFCFLNILISIWINISARNNFKKIENQLIEKIINYYEIDEIIKNKETSS